MPPSGQAPGVPLPSATPAKTPAGTRTGEEFRLPAGSEDYSSSLQQGEKLLSHLRPLLPAQDSLRGLQRCRSKGSLYP